MKIKIIKFKKKNKKIKNNIQNKYLFKYKTFNLKYIINIYIEYININIQKKNINY